MLQNNSNQSDLNPSNPVTGFSLRMIRRVGVGLIGSLVCLIGVVLLFIPGPAFIVIPAGLAILSIEFEFAHRWLHRMREYISKTAQKRRIAKH